MKKLLGLLLTLVFAANIQSFAAGIEVLPTMQSRSNAQDRVWVGTFQLVWNDFMDKIVHNPVRFREGTPVMVHELNNKAFTVDDISEKSYYKITTKVTKNTKRQIEKAIRKKFKESSDILDKMDLTPRNDKFLIYAMLKKDFEFKNEFNKLGQSAFGDGQTAEYFGVLKGSNEKNFGNDVKVLFYNDSNDYAVMLATKTNDEVYLYKNSANKEFQYLYSDMLKKQAAFNGETVFGNDDELKVPNIKLFEEKSFDELSGRRVMGTNLLIDKAIESIKFEMDNKGVKLKSEAAMSIMKMSLMPENEIRRFYFDDTFVIFLKEKDKNNPYFALRVHDITKYQK